MNDKTNNTVSNVVFLVKLDKTKFPDLNISTSHCTNLVDNIYDKDIDKMYENIINKM